MAFTTHTLFPTVSNQFMPPDHEARTRWQTAAPHAKVHPIPSDRLIGKRLTVTGATPRPQGIRRLTAA